MRTLPKWISFTLELLRKAVPVLITIAIWIPVYAMLQQLVKDHESAVVNYGPGAFVVLAHRKRISGILRKAKQIIVKK